VTAPATVSIIINTIDRAPLLRRLLQSLSWLDPGVPFEVIVVIGPCTDETERVAAEWAGRIKIEHCDRPNLSQSRNVGIRAAAGDVVAFIDDDGVPEAEWLVDLVAAYDSDLVGAAGGWVYDHTGVDFQYRFGLVDRLGHARPAPSDTTLRYSFPGAFVFPHLLGTNSSFLRTALIGVGGFDEEYEYFLDESDVLVRVLDAGYRIHHVEGAYVHHKFAPSAIRLDDRFARDRFSIIKNHTYFARRNAAMHLRNEDITADVEEFVAGQRAEMLAALERGVITAEEFEVFDARSPVARRLGDKHATAPRRLLGEPSVPAAFLPFPGIGRPERIVMHGSEAARDAVVIAAAHQFAATGGVAHAVVASSGDAYVDFDNGVWVHAIARSTGSWTSAVDREIKRIGSRRRVDGVRVGVRRSPPTAPLAVVPREITRPAPGADALPDETATIVIATWQLYDEFRDCLDALASQVDAPPFEVVVVLNGSPTRTADMVRRHPIVTHVVALEANVGFGAAANVGATYATSDWLVFLNDDTIPDPFWLARLTSVRPDGQTPVAVTSLLLNFDGTIQEAGSRVLSHGGTVQLGRGLDFEQAADQGFLTPRWVDYGSAAAIAVRREAFVEVGGFAPEYEPAYFEDVDLQLRLAERGGRIWFEPTAKVTHHLGRSTENNQWFRMWAAARAGRHFISTWGPVLAEAADLDDPLDVTVAVPRRDRLPAEGRDPRAVERSSASIAIAQSREFEAWLVEQLEEARAGILEIVPVTEGPTRRELVQHNRLLLARLADLEQRGPWGVAKVRIGLFLSRYRPRGRAPRS
jgi:GT2 family glycosyltransferase